MKILFVTTGLESGGAEMLLYQLVARLHRAGEECLVVSLTDGGPVLGEKIKATGVGLECLGFRRGVPHPGLIAVLARKIRAFGPDLVQTWMYHADLVGGLAARTVGRLPVIWGVHNTDLHLEKSGRMTVAVMQMCRLLSATVPTQIVCCSEAARDFHAGTGYCRAKMTVIANGIDLDEFQIDPEARLSVRQELGISEATPLVGLIARFHPQKDHGTFFKAAALLTQDRPDVHFLLCGTGVTPENETLQEWVRDAGVSEATHLLGLRRDTARITAALDIATCCSCFGESFSLVLGEALACGVPCVTTAMPGPAALVGSYGSVVPIGDPAVLAHAWRQSLEMYGGDRSAWSAQARQYIADTVSLEKMVRGYTQLYERWRPQSG